MAEDADPVSGFDRKELHERGIYAQFREKDSAPADGTGFVGRLGL
jgi:hypothetical protein